MHLAKDGFHLAHDGHSLLYNHDGYPTNAVPVPTLKFHSVIMTAPTTHVVPVYDDGNLARIYSLLAAVK